MRVSDVACRLTCEVTFGAFVPGYLGEVGVRCTLDPTNRHDGRVDSRQRERVGNGAGANSSVRTV
ncbi:hypothetical protein CGRA01v4_04110 [Colletotrichum graminicola]|nr:hypothetical protein CGRA01v4_04110 [Colletotrichum graminicola]